MTNDSTMDLNDLTKKDLTKKEYKDKINYEAILAAQLNRMAMYRDTNPKQYASSVETFALMCPPSISIEAFKEMKKLQLDRGNYDSMNTKKQIKYDDLWRKLSELLNKENLIYKQSSYEIGLEE